MLANLNQPSGSTVGILRDGRTVQEAIDTLTAASGVTADPNVIGSVQAAIDSLPSSGGVVSLPSGTFRGDIKIRSGVALIGAARPVFNTALGQWTAGTLIIGTVGCAGANGFEVANLGIDSTTSTGNGITGTSAPTGNGLVHNVSTRATKHGHLWEANDNNRQNYNAIGNIVVSDCLHWGGANGFVTKHKAVKFIRCWAYDVTIQGFVVASDNINGASVFSRATDTSIVDCWHVNDKSLNPNNEALRIYSRDYNKATPLVLGVQDLIVSNFNGIGCAGAVLRTGENAEDPATFLKVVNTDIKILDMPYNLSPYSCFQFESTNRVHITGCTWGNQSNVAVLRDTVEQLTFGVNITRPGAVATGVEAGRLVVDSGETAMKPTGGQMVISIQNSAPTAVSGIHLGSVGREHYIRLDDNVTTLNLGVPFKGFGTMLHVRHNGTKWETLSHSRGLSTVEFNSTSKVSGGVATLPITAALLAKQFFGTGGNVSAVRIPDLGSYMVDGDTFTLRILNTSPSATITVGGFEGFKNIDTVELTPSEKALITGTVAVGVIVVNSVAKYK